MKAKEPVVKEKRLKMFVYGEAGVGKTLAALQFPNAYIIDTERGTDFYAETIKKSKSVVLQTLNPDDIKEEVRELLTTKHPYKTLIVDPITQVYNATQEKWNRIFEKHAVNGKDKEVMDFGMRYWQKVKSDFKGLQRLLLALDMNVIITAHQKDVYGQGFQKLGVSFDSMKGDDYFFDYIFHFKRKGDERVAEVIKERADIGRAKFPAEFVWSYKNFIKFYGQTIIEREALPVNMAKPAQVLRVQKLVDVVKVDDDTINRWFMKADVDDWDEMSSEQIQKCIDYLEKKVNGIQKGE